MRNECEMNAKLEMYRTVAEMDIRLGGVSVRYGYGYRDMSLRAVTEVVRA